MLELERLVPNHRADGAVDSALLKDGTSSGASCRCAGQCSL